MNNPDIIDIEIDGKVIKAVKGQTIAEALLANGIQIFRWTRKNEPRGIYCNMGICYECRIIVNGFPNVRACLTPVTAGCKVKTQKDADIELEDEKS